MGTRILCCRKTFSRARRMNSRLAYGVLVALLPADENSHQSPISRVLEGYSGQLIRASARRAHMTLGPQMPITPQTSIIALYKYTAYPSTLSGFLNIGLNRPFGSSQSSWLNGVVRATA